MSRSRLIGAAVLALALGVSMPQVAHADGTWPASFTMTPTEASPSEEVSFVGQVSFSSKGPEKIDSGTCLVLFDHSQVEGAPCVWKKSGAFSGSFRVPSDADTGGSSVSVCWPDCYDNAHGEVFLAYWQATASLRIVPVAPPVEVPDVLCLHVKDAAERLQKEGFKVRSSGDVGEVVTNQEPHPHE